VYPYPHVDDLIPLMAEGKILPYLDVPLQHAGPRILKAMKRPANSENTLACIQRWRTLCPDITLRSTFIVGFPGETEDDFERLLDFLRQAELDRVGAFAYSPVEGARANALAHPVPEEIKLERLERFMAVQEGISAAKLQRRVGRIYQVLIDAVDATGATARSASEAPEIDGTIRVSGVPGLSVGEQIKVRITAADDHDLRAEMVG
jgi:ribosomal protein S12 methylthiotransferase